MTLAIFYDQGFPQRQRENLDAAMTVPHFFSIPSTPTANSVIATKYM